MVDKLNYLYEGDIIPTRFIGDGYWEIITRQMSIVNKREQSKFKESKIAVVGCGGIGGGVIEMLARMGVGSLTVIDMDVFDFSNLNRQVMSGLDVLNLPKSEVTKEKIRLINPYVHVDAFNEKITEDNVDKLFNNVDIIIDALDNIITRIIVSRCAKKHNIPFIHGAINGTKGEVAVFTEDCGIDYETMFNMPSKGLDLNEEVLEKINNLTNGVPPVIGPTPSVVGSLEAIEAFKLITGIGELIKAPKLLTFDLLDFNSFNVIEI